MTPKRRLEHVRNLAYLLDDAFRLPGTRFRFGLDGLLGLIPGAGDVLTLIPALYIVYQGHKVGVGTHNTLTMLFNVLLDFLIGEIPIIGDVFDFVWKANDKNVAIIKEFLEPKVRVRQ